MIIEGLSCPCCGAHVLDNPKPCWKCKKPFPDAIRVVQEEHHKTKMANVELMREGQLSISEGVRALPVVKGQSEQKICMVSPGVEGHKTFHLRNKMDCGCDAVRGAIREVWEKATKLFTAARS